jgi:hypothetical protein
VKNEDLVADFEAEIRKICDFAGIEWREEFRDFAARSSARAVVTPSAQQIRSGLSAEGIGHWRNYAADMQSVLPLLNDWAARLGYNSPDGLSSES